MNKNTFIALLTIMGLLFSLIGISSTELTNANPIGQTQIPPPPDAKAPLVTLNSPKNNTCITDNELTLTFDITEPQPEPQNITMVLCEVHYIADWQNIEVTFVTPNVQRQYPPTFNFSGKLANIPTGQHSITVSTMGYFYYASGMNINFYLINSTATAYFENICTSPPNTTLPKISNLTINNQDIFSTLNFTVNKPTRWMAYGINDRPKISTTGNETFPPEFGSNALTVYVVDTDGILAMSETITFMSPPTNSLPYSSPTPTPYPSSTPNPTQTPALNLTQSNQPSSTTTSSADRWSTLTNAKDVVDDASNGILRFTVNDDGNNSILFHSNPEKGIDDTKTLYSNDKVIIDYKGCDVIFKTITEYDFTNGGYTIEFTGEANSVSINGSTVPEFPASLILCFAILAAIGFALLLKKKATVSNKKNNGEKVESRKIKCKTINHFFFGQPC